MATAIGDLVVRLGMDTRKFQSGISAASKSTAMLSATAGVVATAAATAVAAIGTIAVVVTRTAKAMDDIGDAAGNIGIATEALVGLRHQAELSNTSAEALQTGLTKMMQGIGSGASAGALGALGLDPSSLIGLSAEQQFSAIAEAMSKISNRSEQIALATKIFGRNGAELVTMLNGGAAAVEKYAADAKELGIAFNAVDAAVVGKAVDEMYRASAAFKGLKQTLTVQLAPAIATISELFTTFFIEARKNLEVIVGQWFDVADAIAVAADLAKGFLLGQLQIEMATRAAAIAAAQKAGADQAAIGEMQRQLIDVSIRYAKLASEDWGKRVRDKWQEIANGAWKADNAAQQFADDADDMVARFKPATDAAELFAKWFKDARQFSMTDREKQINDLLNAGAPTNLIESLKIADAALTKLEEHAKMVDFAKDLNKQFQDPFDKFIDRVEEIDKAAREVGLDPGVRERAVQAAYEDFAGAPKEFSYSGAMERGSAQAYSTILGAGKDKTAQEQLQVGRMSLEQLRQLNRNTQPTSTVSIPTG